MTGIFYEHIIEGAEQRGISAGEVLETVRKIGYEGLECDLWRLRGTAAGKPDSGVKRLFDGCGMRVLSVYHVYDLPHESGEKCREKYLPHLEAAAFFGAEKILCVPGFCCPEDNTDVCMERTALRLSEMCDTAKGYGITVMIEDYDDINSPCCRTSQLEYLLGNVPSLGFAFDTGNFAYCCEDAGAAYERLCGRVVHVHLKDRSWEGECGMKEDISGRKMFACPAGEGFIGIKDIIGRLLADGYSGDFSAEHFGAADQIGFMERSFEKAGKLTVTGSH